MMLILRKLPRLFAIVALCLFSVVSLSAARSLFTLSGKVIDDANGESLAYASVRVADTGLRAVTDGDGRFRIANVPPGRISVEVSILGFAPRTLSFDLQKDTDLKNIRLKESNLSLPDVDVTAQRKPRDGATSYVMGRNVLDHLQVLNLTDIMSLLPGQQTVNSTLVDDSRIALRSGSGENGNPSFGTAIQIDGVRIDNNANMDETKSASTRGVSASNIERVEVVPGIPGVEHGDVSNGVVNIVPRRGRTPWIVEMSVNPYSRQIALNKGLRMPSNAGILNVSAEHARSFSNISSPHTAYQRNSLSLNYTQTFFLPASNLNLQAGITGNIGGYSSEADPDAFSDTYTRVRDNQLQANLKLDWLFNNSRAGVFRVTLLAAVQTSDKRTESYTNASSSSTQAYLHTIDNGYNIARTYGGGDAVGSIVLGPTGYWYVRAFNDQKPLSLQFKLKGEWTKEGASLLSKATVGAEFSSSKNRGRGIYYEDFTYAPTWRPYDYRTLPALNTAAAFVEEKLIWKRFTLTAGVRSDITSIRNSQYGTVSTFSPRVNAQIEIFKSPAGHMNLYGGFGRGYKLPSFQVLYPADSYSDKLTFTPGSTVDNKAYYAYYTHVSKSLYNRELRWQSADQAEIGVDASFKGVKLSLSAFSNYTRNPYQLVNLYTPFTYTYTSQAALENCGIPSELRSYSVDSATGEVTVTSTADGSSIRLPYTQRNTYISNRKYVNGAPVRRYGLEWILDIPVTGAKHPVGLSLRFDGTFYRYKGISNTLIAGSPSGIGDYDAASGITPLIGYYAGSASVSTGLASTASVSNGYLSKGCSVNSMLTMRVPRLRMIVTLRFESTFLNYKRNLSDSGNAILLAAAGDVTGTPYAGQTDAYVALYPEYYSTWENPAERIPFAQKLAEAQQSDPQLYRQLCNLIVRSNTAYYFNPQKLSAYFSANFSITKEIGRWISISFYANNFFNNMMFVRNTQTGLETSLFSSGYIPKFYYGATLRIKI